MGRGKRAHTTEESGEPNISTAKTQQTKPRRLTASSSVGVSSLMYDSTHSSSESATPYQICTCRCRASTVPSGTWVRGQAAQRAEARHRPAAANLVGRMHEEHNAVTCIEQGARAVHQHQRAICAQQAIFEPQCRAAKSMAGATNRRAESGWFMGVSTGFQGAASLPLP